jgi:LCP family protein required for cell wall assembly
VCKDTCNFLLLGSDSRNGLSQKDQKGFIPSNQLGGYNSDTILLVHADTVTKHATIISFPRDLWVNIPGHGTNKINAAFSIGSAGHGGIAGGAALAAQTVSSLTGLPIQHAMVVDLAGFQNIVDALNTVPFCTPVPLVDAPPPSVVKQGDAGSGLNLPHPGCYDLDGPTALALVRARYVRGDCVGDFARIARQQQFLRSVMNKMLSPSEVTNLPTLIPAVMKSLTVDNGLKVTDLVDLAKSLQGVASGNADFRTVPSKPGFEKVPQYSFPLSVLHIQPQGYELFKRLKNNQPLGDLGKQIAYTPPSPADISVRVYDDNSQGKAEQDVYTANLSNAGFAMMATAAQPAGPLAGLSNVILYKKGFENQAKVVAGYVPGVPMKQAAEGQLPDDTQVGIVINHDYVHKNVGTGKTPSVQVNCPYSP